MARPKQASDAEVMETAERIYAQRGHQGFTLSELAREVNLSRAAIIQRFGNAEGLRMRMARQHIAHFQKLLEQLPVSRDGDALIALAAFVGQLVGGRQQLTAFMLNLHADLQDEKLGELQKERAAALHQAIALRMPPVAIEPESAVSAFRAHLSGSLIQWQSSPEAVSAGDFLAARTREWLRLASVPFSGDAMDRQAPSPQAVTAAASEL
jgi:TetR/AcrR family macrolide resistance operon transcriptional repressor